MPQWEQSPGQTHAAVTPNDSTVLAFRALYVGTGGAVVIKDPLGTVVTYSNVPSGFIIPMAGIRVMSATTASNIVAMQ
jgi:energy-converting hydrogenase Eha subunit C